MASIDVEMYDSDSSNALSDALGTQTLATRSMVPEDYRETPLTPNQSWAWESGRQFLKVDHAANIRMGTPISEILLRAPFLLPTNLVTRFGPSGSWA
jgi:hypothetical protein